MKHQIPSCALLSIFLFLVLIAPGCAGEDGEIQPAAVTGHCSLLSRAAGEPVSDTEPNELINNWWVVFVDGSGIVRQIVRNSPDFGEPVDRDEFTVALPASTYRVYAFANISQVQLYEHTGLRFEIGEKIDMDMAEVQWSDMENNPGASALVPMSGTATINFRNSNIQFSIELIRMLAKIRLSVKNTSSTPIVINTLTFGLLNKGAVRLLPDYASLGSCPDILEEAAGQKEELVFNPRKNLGFGQSADEVFYVRESSAIQTHPAQRYFITFGITRQDGVSTEEHYALTDGLQWIQRNDFIDIPIVISDLTVDWQVLFYPPIGGYPAVVTEADGDNHFFTFGTPGKFTLRPEIRSNGSVVGQKDFSFEILGIEGDSVIFASLPARDPVTGEITGELSVRSGTAVLTCAVTVNIEGEKIVRVRKIYIIRK